jgi:23S rRNA (adenine1618-N6)-methyltransferase
VGFVKRMAVESKASGSRCLWFSCLVSRSAHLPLAAAAVQRAGALDVRNVAMGQGHKASSLLLWTFVAPGAAHAAWARRRGWAEPDKTF